MVHPQVAAPRSAGRLPAWLPDALVGVVTATALVTISAHISPGPDDRGADAVQYLLLAAAGGAMALIRRRPRTAAALATFILCVEVARRYPDGPVWAVGWISLAGVSWQTSRRGALGWAGIHWMRTLLKEFANDGGSVLLSSHLLHEIEVVADDLVVIGRGRIVARGRKNELLASSGAAVRSTDDEGLAAAMRAAGMPFTDHSDGGFTVSAEAEHVANLAAAAGITLRELRRADDGGLEQLFLRLTADDAREDVRS